MGYNQQPELAMSNMEFILMMQKPAANDNEFKPAANDVYDDERKELNIEIIVKEQF